jgi:hypothetical protein
MNPNLLFAFRQRYRLSGEPVHANPFEPWTEDDVFPTLDIDDDVAAAGLWDKPECEEIYQWLEKLGSNQWPLFFLIEQCSYDGELLDLDMRATRLSSFPLEATIACEHAIDSIPHDIFEDIIFVIHWAVRIERARRRGRP